MMEKIDTMELWRAVEKTPLEQTKPITGKAYKGTSPKPQYMIQKATETFGPCGIGWGFKIVEERIEDAGLAGKMSIARVAIWYDWHGKRGEAEHIGGTPFCGTRKDGTPFVDEDAPKKSVTDALIKALSMIGFAGDIFMGRYDDSKYIAELKVEEKTKQENKPARQQETPFDKRPDAPLHHIPVPLDEEGYSDWQAWTNSITGQIATASSMDVLNALWTSNRSALKEARIAVPKMFERIVVAKDTNRQRLSKAA